MSFEKYIMICIYHCSIKQNGFICLIIPCAPSIHPSLSYLKLLITVNFGLVKNGKESVGKESACNAGAAAAKLLQLFPIL